MKKIRKGWTVNIAGGGYVRYVRHLGSDKSIAQAARTSTKKHRDEQAEFERLLDYLFRMRHTSPFEQASITFEIQMPIFVMRQFVRHRTFRLNEQSARYAPLDGVWWSPQPHHIRMQNTSGNKQGSAGKAAELHARWFVEKYEEMCQWCFEVYERAIESGIAREQARAIVPLGTMTTIMVNIDVHNLVHFLYLRTHPHAQPEIRLFAEAMRDVFAGLFPVTAALFEKYEPKMVERVKP